MQYLGINWDHPAGASIMQDGQVRASVCEERFSRVKNDMRFPKESLDYCMKFATSQSKIGGIGVAGKDASYTGMLYHYATMDISQHIVEQRQIWYPRLYEGKEVDDAIVLRNIWDTKQFPAEYWSDYNPAKRHTYAIDRLEIISDYTGIEQEHIREIEHHWCHAYYGYYASPFTNDKAVVITIDGFGDGFNATVSLAEHGVLRRIYATDKCVLGRIYRHVTLLLGMKPLEHEFKVMGLAPYSKKEHAKVAYEVFSDLLSLEGIEFKWKNKPKDSYFHFQKKLEGVRFDNVAAGLQWWIEDLLCEWISNIIHETGIDTIVISGGVAMNIKAMGEIAGLSCVNRMFVPGSGSDDSNCIGAAIGAAIELTEGRAWRQKPVVPSLYLGPDANEHLEEVLVDAESKEDYVIYRDPSDELICSFLTKGLVIGRCIGRMEFGQRALGNRSILADPVNPDVVPRINAMIKNRDFWMPFAPIVLDTYQNRYLENPKKIESPHMTIGFRTTEEGYRCMRAACHPADRSARPQIIREAENPGVYELLRCFSDMTGRGALLNTSFNLHGYPIVNTARDGYSVFESTELEGLLLPGILMIKRARVN